MLHNDRHTIGHCPATLTNGGDGEPITHFCNVNRFHPGDEHRCTCGRTWEAPVSSERPIWQPVGPVEDVSPPALDFVTAQQTYWAKRLGRLGEGQDPLTADEWRVFNDFLRSEDIRDSHVAQDAQTYCGFRHDGGETHNHQCGMLFQHPGYQHICRCAFVWESFDDRDAGVLRGYVTEAGGGKVTIVIDRDLESYPAIGDYMRWTHAALDPNDGYPTQAHA